MTYFPSRFDIVKFLQKRVAKFGSEIYNFSIYISVINFEEGWTFFNVIDPREGGSVIKIDTIIVHEAYRIYEDALQAISLMAAIFPARRIFRPPTHGKYAYIRVTRFILLNLINCRP